MRFKAFVVIGIISAMGVGFPFSGIAMVRPKHQALPEAIDILRQAMEPEVPAYEGRVRVGTKELRVRYEPPGLYRREILDAEGKPVQVVISDGKTEWIYDKARHKVWQGEASDPDDKRLGLDEECDLLKANYDVAISSSDRVARRAVWLLSLRSHFDGALRRRLWVDQKTGLVLKSQVFAADGSLASDMEFQTAVFPKKAQSAHFFEFSPPRGAQLVKRAEPDFMALDEAQTASGMDPRTPAWLPSGYVFESLDVLPRGGRNIIHYRYSDGVNVLSLFQCPARFKLDFGGRDGREVSLASGTGTMARTAEGNVLGWTDGPSQFVLVGAVPADALERVAGSIR
jgi:outer membrane lipoprotein-sorting protein